MEYNDLLDGQVKALLKSPSSLADVFRDWEHKKTDYMEDIWQTVADRTKPKRNKRLHFLLREDLAKMDAISEEVKLLVGNHIDTAEQLSSYKEGLESRIKLLTADRKSLYRKQRTVSVKPDEEALTKVKAQIADISKELAALRRWQNGIGKIQGVYM